MSGFGVSDDLMEQMIGAAFSKLLDDALRPVVQRLTELEIQLGTVCSTVADVQALVDRVKSKGGMAAKVLGLAE